MMRVFVAKGLSHVIVPQPYFFSKEITPPLAKVEGLLYNLSMLPLKIIQQDYTATEDYFQLVLPLNIESIIPKDDSVRLLRQMVERMNLSRLNQSYSRIGKNQATPRQLLSIVLYAYMNCIYSTRDIERACKRDINFMYLLEGKHAPDHATIARFRNKHFAPIAKEILDQHVDALKELGEISLENIFIDVTKIEAVANKYTFVWKKAVLKNREKMLAKIPKTIEQIGERPNFFLLFSVQIRKGMIY